MKHPIAILLILLLILTLCSCSDNTVEISAMRADVTALIEEIEELRKENDELKQAIVYMSEQIETLSKTVIQQITEDSSDSLADTTPKSNTIPYSNTEKLDSVNDISQTAPSPIPAASDTAISSNDAQNTTEPSNSVSVESESVTISDSSSSETIIYITATGSKYHYDSNCNSGTYFKSTMADALAKGLTPCKKCAGG